jgi:hypothetical protein
MCRGESSPLLLHILDCDICVRDEICELINVARLAVSQER